jgi:hypothetical protein
MALINTSPVPFQLAAPPACGSCPECQQKQQRGMGDLSFDGTGLFGTGLFGYTPWYDTSQWTILEWAAAAFVAWQAMKLLGGLRGGYRSRTARRAKRKSLQSQLAAL